MWFVGATTRKTYINRHFLETLDREGKNFILAIWHNNMVMTIYLFRRRGINSVISASRDGDLSAFVQTAMGFRAARGGSSSNSLGVFRVMLRALRRGESIAITPDGPRGPKYILKPGVAALSRKTQVPILPMCADGAGTLHLRTWDRLRLPIPFSRVTVMFGTPILVGEEENDAEATKRIEQAMRKDALHLDQFLGGRLTPTEPLLAELLAEPLETSQL